MDENEDQIKTIFHLREVIEKQQLQIDVSDSQIKELKSFLNEDAQIKLNYYSICASQAVANLRQAVQSLTGKWRGEDKSFGESHLSCILSPIETAIEVLENILNREAKND